MLKLLDAAERLPEWLRPVAYGPLLVAGIMMAKGVLIGGPILLAIVLFRSPDPAHDLLMAAAALGIALGSSAMGGLAYSLLGRPIDRAFSYGWLPAGWLAFFPYLLGVTLIIRIIENAPLLAPITGLEWAVIGIMTAFFGTQIGYLLLGPGK